MLFLRSMAIDMVSVGVVLVPILLVAQAVFYKTRPIAQKLALLAFSMCVVAIFSVTGLPTVLYHPVDFSFSFVPFAGFSSSPAQYFFNVLLFVPIGFFAPLVWGCFQSFRRTALLGFALSLFIELAQIFTLRVTDINDLFTNTLGAIAGFFLAKAVLHFYKHATPPLPSAKRAVWADAKEPLLLLASVFLLQYLFQPLISEFLWSFIL